METTLLVFQLPIGWLKFIAQPNIWCILFTLLTSQLEISELNLTAPWNMLIVDQTLLVCWFDGKIIWLLKSLNKPSALSGNQTSCLNSTLVISSVFRLSVFTMVFHLAVTICPVPTQRGWTVKIWVPWSQTPSTFVQRSKVWLGTLTAAKVRKLHIPPKKTKLKIRKTKGLKNIFINRNTKQLKNGGTIRIFSKKATLPLLPSSSKVQSIPLTRKNQLPNNRK